MKKNDANAVPGERWIRPSEVKALAKKAKEAEEVAVWDDISDAVPDFPELAARHRELTDTEGACAKEKKVISPQLEAAVLIGGKKSLITTGFKVTRVYNSGRKVVSPERLVEVLAALEYTAEQITEIVEKCTKVEGAGYYPLVTRIEVEDEA